MKRTYALGICFALVIGGFSSLAFSEQNPQEIQLYAQKIAADPEIPVESYLGVYQRILRSGKTPLDAYRATYIYEKGYELGYYYGFVTANGQPSPDNYSSRDAWLNSYKDPNSAWSQRLWGWFEQGYLDGELRGSKVATLKETLPPNTVTPRPTYNDLFTYQQSLGIDPNDPWSDLRVVERIRGPL